MNDDSPCLGHQHHVALVRHDHQIGAEVTTAVVVLVFLSPLLGAMLAVAVRIFHLVLGWLS